MRGSRPALVAVRWTLGLVLAGTLPACQFPRDADGTLDRVRGGALRAGLAYSPPWVTAVEPPAGVEVRLVEELADTLGARVEWTDGSEEDLVQALKFRQLDLVVGGLTSKSPWQQEAGLTRHHLTTRVVVAAAPGVASPGDLDGVPIAVEEGTEAAGVVRDKIGAEPVPVPDVAERRDLLVAVEDWRLDELGLAPTGAQVTKTEHVVAVPLGENGWQTTVERFLLAKGEAQFDRLLDEEAGEAGG